MCALREVCVISPYGQQTDGTLLFNETSSARAGVYVDYVRAHKAAHAPSMLWICSRGSGVEQSLPVHPELQLQMPSRQTPLSLQSLGQGP
jgi:hypothetical protein